MCPRGSTVQSTGLAVHSTLSEGTCPTVLEGPCSAAGAAGEETEPKHKETSCVRAPAPEPKPSWP